VWSVDHFITPCAVPSTADKTKYLRLAIFRSRRLPKVWCRHLAYCLVCSKVGEDRRRAPHNVDSAMRKPNTKLWLDLNC